MTLIQSKLVDGKWQTSQRTMRPWFCLAIAMTTHKPFQISVSVEMQIFWHFL